MAKQVTLSEVAKLVGVDQSTVSRVLRGDGRVSPTTRERILDTAAQLDFLPNAQAQFLATGVSKTVGVLTLNAPGAFTMQVIAGIGRALGLNDVATLHYDTAFNEERLRESVRKLKARRIDGLLVIGDGFMTPMRSVSEGFDVPVVYAFGIPDDERDATFIPDGEMGGRLAGEHLIGLGRRRIAHITAEGDLAAAARARGLQTALDAAGLPLMFGRPIEGEWHREWGVAAARQILESGEPVDAVFCGNDQIALGVYGVIRAAGMRIPDDIAIVGYDNWEGLAAASNNLLTTINPDLVGVGYAAGRYVDELTSATFVPGPHLHPCSLVLGETTLGAGPLSNADREGKA